MTTATVPEPADYDVLERAERTGDWPGPSGTGPLERLALHDPDTVVTAALRSGTGWADLPPVVAATMSARHLLAGAEPADRGLLLSLALARLAPGAAPEVPDAGGCWRLLWSDLWRDHPHVVASTEWELLDYRDDPLVVVPLAADRSLLAFRAGKRTVRVWDPLAPAAHGRNIRTRGTSTALAAALVPDVGPVLAVAESRVVRLWDPRTGKELSDPIAHQDGRITALSWLTMPDGRTVLATGGGADRAVRLWTVGGRTAGPSLELPNPAGPVQSIVPWPLQDGRLALAVSWNGSRGELRTWEPATGEQLGEMDWTAAYASVPAPDGRMLLATDAQHPQPMWLWDPRTGKPAEDVSTAGSGNLYAMCHLRTPDGGLRYAASDGNAIRLWDPSSDGPGTRLSGHTNDVRSLVAVPMPGGRQLLASAGLDDTVRLWDPAAADLTDPGRPGREAVPHVEGVTDLATVPVPAGPPLLASFGGGGEIRLRDAATGGPAGPPLRVDDGRVRDLAAVRMADGRCLVAASTDERRVVLWDPATGERVARTAPRNHSVVAMAAGGTVLAMGGSGVMRWDSATEPWQLTRLPIQFGYRELRAMAWLTLPGGRPLLATGTAGPIYNRGGHVQLWDAARGTPIGGPLPDHDGAVAALLALPLAGGRSLLATAVDDKVRWHDPMAGGSGWPTIDAPGVRALATFPLDGRTVLATGGQDRTVQVWDPRDGSTVDCGPITARGRVAALAPLPLPDGRTLLAVAGGRTIVRWDPAAGAAVGKALRGHTDVVTALATVSTTDGRVLLASASADHTIRLWDAETGEQAGEPLAGHTDKVLALAVLPGPDGGALLASGGEDTELWLWDVSAPPAGPATGRRITGRAEPVSPATVLPAPDGRTMLATEAGEAWLWSTDVRSDRPAAPMPEAELTVVPMPDGRTLLATESARGDEPGVRLFDAATGEPAGEVLPGIASVFGHRLSVLHPPGGGTRLAVGDDSGTIRQWDLDAGRTVGEAMTDPQESSTLRQVVLTLPGGRELLATASYAGVVKLWDPADGRCLHTLTLHTSIWTLAVDGGRLMVGCFHGVLALEPRLDRLELAPLS